MDFLLLPLLGISLIFVIGCALMLAYVVLYLFWSFALLLVKEWRKQHSFQPIR